MNSIIKSIVITTFFMMIPAIGQAQTAYSTMRQSQEPNAGAEATAVPPAFGPFRGVRGWRGADPYQGRYPGPYHPGPYQGYPQGYPQGQAEQAPGYAGTASSMGYGAEPAWTQHLIKNADRSFDFKTVARGSRVEHRFVLTNAFMENVRIASVTSSCSCASVSILDNKNELQTYEKGVIVAQFRADLFEGPKSATITVVVDRPLYAEFHLNVRGDIRSDVTLKPTSVRFENIPRGEDVTRTLDVVYTGYNPAWKIVEFKSGNEHLSAEIEDVQTRPGLTTTRIKVKLDDKTPVGSFMDRLFLITNDPGNRREISVLVQATVGTTITVTPETLFFGYLKPGEGASKIVVLQGSKPFSIKKLLCSNPAVETGFTPKDDAPPKTRHILPIKYLNPVDGPGAPKDGKMRAVVKIETDDPELTPSFNVMMELAKEEPKEESEAEKEGN